MTVVVELEENGRRNAGFSVSRNRFGVTRKQPPSQITPAGLPLVIRHSSPLTICPSGNPQSGAIVLLITI